MKNVRSIRLVRDSFVILNNVIFASRFVLQMAFSWLYYMIGEIQNWKFRDVVMTEVFDIGYVRTIRCLIYYVWLSDVCLLYEDLQLLSQYFVKRSLSFSFSSLL